MTQEKTPEKTPVAVPEGFEERTSDVVGMWNPELTPSIVCVPLYANVGDSKKFDKTKPSLLIFARLVSGAVLRGKDADEDDEDDIVEGRSGDLIGIWAKPGMRDIADCCDVETFIARDTSKDKNVDKGNDMKGYRVAAALGSPKKAIPILNDRRDISKGNRCFLDPVDYGRASPAKAPVRGSDLPF